MTVLDELRRARRVYAECPQCSEEFSLARADLFDVTKPLSARGLEHLQLLQAALVDDKAAFDAMKMKAEETSRLGAQRVGIGKMVEKIAPSLPGFPLTAADCRSLLEPIDYIAFPGLTATGLVESLLFVDVKSGQARLTKVQRAVRSLVERGTVSLVLTEPAETNEVEP